MGRCRHGWPGSTRSLSPSGPRTGRPRTTAACWPLTQAQQNQGLMNRTDLAGYDAMLFQFLGADRRPQFYMKDTLIPLSIAWFDANGHFVSAADMSPCGTALVCPLYAAHLPVHRGHRGDQGRSGPSGRRGRVRTGGRRVLLVLVTPLCHAGGVDQSQTSSYHDQVTEPCPGAAGAPSACAGSRGR